MAGLHTYKAVCDLNLSIFGHPCLVAKVWFFFWDGVFETIFKMRSGNGVCSLSVDNPQALISSPPFSLE